MNRKSRATSILAALPPQTAKKPSARIPPEEIGQRLRQLRQSRDLSLSDASRLTGVPEATLSRIETSKMSPTFGMLFKIVEGLGFDWQDMLARPPRAPSAVSVSRLDEIAFTRLADIPYSYALLHQGNTGGLRPLRMRVHATSVEEAGGLAGHAGMEFCYVLSGTLAVSFEGKEPVTLTAGESALFSSAMPHAYTTPRPDDTEILIVLANRDSTVRF
ncbi:XRE family transcriptional regulator [Paraburkholderia acidicola]|uniref:XRE family transcriptional regulator n=1 Tax=Paraburkholderia acidicola TaxID=1912599 RepID=A0ABV1LXA3_9BURK